MAAAAAELKRKRDEEDAGVEDDEESLGFLGELEFYQPRAEEEWEVKTWEDMRTKVKETTFRGYSEVCEKYYQFWRERGVERAAVTEEGAVVFLVKHRSRSYASLTKWIKGLRCKMHSYLTDQSLSGIANLRLNPRIKAILAEAAKRRDESAATPKAEHEEAAAADLASALSPNGMNGVSGNGGVGGEGHEAGGGMVGLDRERRGEKRRIGVESGYYAERAKVMATGVGPGSSSHAHTPDMRTNGVASNGGMAAAMGSSPSSGVGLGFVPVNGATVGVGGLESVVMRVLREMQKASAALAQRVDSRFDLLEKRMIEMHESIRSLQQHVAHGSGSGEAVLATPSHDGGEDDGKHHVVEHVHVGGHGDHGSGMQLSLVPVASNAPQMEAAELPILSNTSSIVEVWLEWTKGVNGLAPLKYRDQMDPQWRMNCTIPGKELAKLFYNKKIVCEAIETIAQHNEEEPKLREEDVAALLEEFRKRRKTATIRPMRDFVLAKKKEVPREIIEVGDVAFAREFSRIILAAMKSTLLVPTSLMQPE